MPGATASGKADRHRSVPSSAVRVVDAERPRETSVDATPAPRRVVEVAVGVLIDKSGDFLLTSRPAGKVYAGYWEFPGGKIEPGESVEQALARELDEELGIRVNAVTRWKTELVDYPHALVRLNFCKVYDWTGELHMHEGQSFAWEQLPVQVQPLLPGTVPVIGWFEEERA